MSKIIVREIVQRIIPDAPDMVLKTAAGGRGPKGDSMLSGHGAPAGALGVDGDTYLDLDTGNWYGPKATGAWGGAVANSLLPLVAAAAASADQAAANRALTAADVATTHADRQDADAAATATAADRAVVAALSHWVTKSANYTLVAGDQILADSTAASFNLTLPASPADGDRVATSDPKSSWGTHPVTLLRNGKTILGIADDLSLNSPGATIGLAYSASAGNWSFV